MNPESGGGSGHLRGQESGGSGWPEGKAKRKDMGGWKGPGQGQAEGGLSQAVAA